MADLDLKINVKDAQAELNDALRRMRNMAHQPIVATLRVDFRSVTAAIKQLDNLRKLSDRIGTIKIQEPNISQTTGDTSSSKKPGRKKGSKNSSSNVTDATKLAKGITDAADKLTKAEAKLTEQKAKVRNKLAKHNVDSNDQDLTQLLGAIDKKIAQYQKARKDLQKAANLDDVKNITNQQLNGKDKSFLSATDVAVSRKINKLSEAGAALGGTDSTKATDKFTKELDKLEKQAADAEKSLASLSKQMSALCSRTGAALKEDPAFMNMRTQVDAKLAEIQAQRDVIKSLKSGAVDSSAADTLNNTKNIVDGIRKNVTDIQIEKNKYERALNDLNNPSVLMATHDKLGNRLTSYFKQHQSAIEHNSVLFDKYNTLMNNFNSQAYKSTRDANHAFASFRMECRKAGVEVDSFGSLLQRTFGSRVRSAMAGQGVYMIQTALRDILQSSIQVDTAMTELKKVTDLTETGYNNFLEGAEKRASKLGATLTEVVNATADYARLGYSVPDASQMADTALIYENVGDGIENIDDATSVLISTMQGFGIQAKDSMNIVDQFNEVANKFPSSAGDIGEIVKRSASAMASANNTLAETVALGVTANTVVQDADVVGTAMKTLSMRLRGSKTELEDAGLDTEGMASSVSTLRKEMLALTGVDVMLDDTNFKSTYQILMDIGEIWNNLNDITQANVVELLFGKRQGNIGTAILDNYTMAEDIVKTAENSFGSAERENEKYLESVQGHLDQLQAKWQSFGANLADSELLKGFIDIGGGIISVVDTMTSMFSSLGVVLLPVIASLSKLGNIGKINMPSYMVTYRMIMV